MRNLGSLSDEGEKIDKVAIERFLKESKEEETK